jgi:hypothetical protein
MRSAADDIDQGMSGHLLQRYISTESKIHCNIMILLDYFSHLVNYALNDTNSLILVVFLPMTGRACGICL